MKAGTNTFYTIRTEAQDIEINLDNPKASKCIERITALEHGLFNVMLMLTKAASVNMIIESPAIPEPQQTNKLPDYTDLITMIGMYMAFGCEYFAKDKDGSVYAYNDKPVRRETYWSIPNRKVYVIRLKRPLKHISWSDKEPYHFQASGKHLRQISQWLEDHSPR